MTVLMLGFPPPEQANTEYLIVRCGFTVQSWPKCHYSGNVLKMRGSKLLDNMNKKYVVEKWLSGITVGKAQCKCQFYHLHAVSPLS